MRLSKVCKMILKQYWFLPNETIWTCLRETHLFPLKMKRTPLVRIVQNKETNKHAVKSFSISKTHILYCICNQSV